MSGYSIEAILLALVIVVVTFLWFQRRPEKNGTPHTLEDETQKIRDSESEDDDLLKRPLGRVESIFYEHQTRGIELVANVFIFTSSEPCDEQLLGLAMALLAKTHHLLRMRVVSQTGRDVEEPVLYFKESEYLRVDMDVDKNSTSWKDKLENELLRVFKDGDPLWRVAYLPDSAQTYTDDLRPYQQTFVFTFHHAIVDGTALVKLMGDFLKFVEQVHQHLDDEFVITSLPLPPTVEEVAGYISERRPSFFYHACLKALSFKPLGVVLQKLAPWVLGGNKWMTKPINSSKLCQTSPMYTRKTAIVPVEFSEADTKMLSNRAKEESVTIFSAFTAATALAWREMLLKDSTEETESLVNNIQIDVAVDLRQEFLTQHNGNLETSRDPDMLDHVGCLSAIVPTKYSFGESTDTFWNIAREYQSLIHKDIGSRVCDSFAIFELYSKIVTADYNPFEDDEGRYPVDMTNNYCGKFHELSRPQDCPFKSAAIFVSRGGHVVGPTLHNNLVTFNDRLFWSMSYFTNVMTQEDAEEFVRKTTTFLMDAIKP